MKKIILSTLVVPFALSAFSALAAGGSDGTIQFNGSIVDTPCVVATESQNQSVELGTVKSSTFAAAGDKSVEKPFQIKLEECDLSSGKTKVSVAFNGLSDDTDTTLLSVANGAGSAEGVGIGIFDTDNQQIDLNKASTATNLQEGETILNYAARYVSTAAKVTAGSANSEVDFSLTYE
ncbi:long polar fimbrial protein LpfA [Enterobacteriaceae bacterium 89]|nr:long polar fimbrial protein LpfA [Enterobacteriaceae bacterium 89]